MKQQKNNKHHKTIQEEINQSQGEYKIILDDRDGEEGGFFMDMADIKIMYNALKQYTPTEKEEQLYELLLETFDEEIWIDEHKNDEE
jgi:hypothetical protein